MDPFNKLSDWHKALLALIFFSLLILKAMSLASEVEKQGTEILKIQLWRVNEKIWKFEDRFSCYSEQECLSKMPNDIKEQYRDELEIQKELNEEMKRR